MSAKATEKNELFPVFLKLNDLSVLIIGGGKVGLEKLSAVLLNSPLCIVTVVAETVIDEILELTRSFPQVKVIIDSFNATYLEGKHVVISALNNVEVSAEIGKIVKSKGLLYNAADKPDLCDFYLGAVVVKGNLKIGISTNGKSPTMAKRIKEILNEAVPDETEEVLDNLREIRTKLKGDFETKVKTLNAITQDYLIPIEEKSLYQKIKKTIFYSVLVIFSMLIGHILLSYIPFASVRDLANDIRLNLDENIVVYFLIGFIAQMIDGALGMAYGVSVSTALMSLGLPTITPAVASASMHASEIFTTGSSSLVYMRFKNVNRKLFKALVWPGVVGAILGVFAVSFISKEYFTVIKPFVSTYTLVLGVLILIRTLKKEKKQKKFKQLGPIAFFGGFLDSVGGGGWGPIVTSSLLASGRSFRYAIGSAHLAKFFVALTSTVTFFIFIGLSHWQIIFGLVVGGMVAAPFSIYLSTKIPIKKGLILVGGLIIIISLKTIIQSLF
jgi:siroheme synthase-like protein